MQKKVLNKVLPKFFVGCQIFSGRRFSELSLFEDLRVLSHLRHVRLPAQSRQQDLDLKFQY